MSCIHHYSVIQSSFTALNIPVLHLFIPPPPPTPWQPLITVYSFASSRMSYSWNHTVYSLFRLAFSAQHHKSFWVKPSLPSHEDAVGGSPWEFRIFCKVCSEDPQKAFVKAFMRHLDIFLWSLNKGSSSTIWTSLFWSPWLWDSFAGWKDCPGPLHSLLIPLGIGYFAFSSSLSFLILLQCLQHSAWKPS